MIIKWIIYLHTYDKQDVLRTTIDGLQTKKREFIFFVVGCLYLTSIGFGV
jgi:hypothetical protein